MKILIGCEYSGRVRDSFIKYGHKAVSVDFVKSQRPGPHIIADIRDIISDQWDMMIVFPPCTALCNSGNIWYAGTSDRDDALDFIRHLMSAPIDKIAIENPVGAISSNIRKPDQIIQPYWFGAPWPKQTCLWLKNLPPLVPTNIVKIKNRNRIHHAGGNNQWEIRSKTPWGIAKAMAEQWSLAP